jgi:transcription termination factor NusB
MSNQLSKSTLTELDVTNLSIASVIIYEILSQDNPPNETALICARKLIDDVRLQNID